MKKEKLIDSTAQLQKIGVLLSSWKTLKFYFL